MEQNKEFALTGNKKIPTFGGSFVPGGQMINLEQQSARRDGRVVEGARLESVYTSKGYRGFESRSLRQILEKQNLNVTKDSCFLVYLYICGLLAIFNTY
jgi:hypothetical protein